MLAPSVLPPSRFFPAPAAPFDTEIAVVAASNVTRADEHDSAITYVAAEDAPDSPRFALVRAALRSDPQLAAQRIVEKLRSDAAGGQRIVVAEDPRAAAAMDGVFSAVPMRRIDLTFWGVDAAELARSSPEGVRIELEGLVGDDAWRDWANVERELLGEAIAPAPLTEALLDRSVRFKRRQQRDTPPIRRFVGLFGGAPATMIGYAPFASCDLGFARRGVLVRLRDVGVLPQFRARGLGRALLAAIAERAIAECGATQVLICGASDGVPAALYRRAGARAVGRAVMWT